MTKAELHRLVDELPEHAVEVAGDLLRRAAEDPDLAHLLAAPWDDEPYTAEERVEDAEALRRIDAGEGIEWDEAQRRLRAAG
jgi:hypothetical protein